MAKFPQETVLSFFTTVSRKDFTHLYRLPQEFMENHGSDFPRKVKLRIKSGRTWDVKVETMDDGHFCFKTGWDVFAKEIALKFTEFLIFTLDNSDGYTVDVSHYDSNGCINDDDDDDDDDVDDDDDDDIEEDNDANDDGVQRRNPLYYEIVFNKSTYKYRHTLRRQFVRASGLMRKDSVLVVGKYRTLCVGLYKTQKDKTRLDLTSQWFEFQKINGIVYGKRYSFEFKPDTNAIHINELV